jgi:hypothetical protein
MNEDCLLNKDELERVIEIARNPIYKQSNVLFIGSNKTDIIRVSPNKELILIYGNNKTGLIHINNRHNSIFKLPYWKKKKIEGKNIFILDNPSQYSKSTIPFYDYIAIAEEVYNQKNLNTKCNTNPLNYDLYEGDVDLGHIENCTYRLILYKGTKVIHNLYPKDDKFTPKKILNLHKGSVSMIQNLRNCISIIEIPYLNHANIPIYKIIFRLDEITKYEKLFIQINSDKGIPLICKYLGERPYNRFDQKSSLKLLGYEFADLSAIEKIIYQIETKRKKV